MHTGIYVIVNVKGLTEYGHFSKIVSKLTLVKDRLFAPT